MAYNYRATAIEAIIDARNYHAKTKAEDAKHPNTPPMADSGFVRMVFEILDQVNAEALTIALANPAFAETIQSRRAA